MNRLILILSSIFISIISFADPIQDLSMNNYKAGWYPNFYKGYGPMTCPRTCKYWVGTDAEHEASQEIDGQSERVNVCKITRDESIILEPKNDPKSHWIYGGQYDDYPVCFANSLGYGPVQSRLFMCECVEPQKPSGCPNPDLVVSKIHDPVWDHPNGVSIVKVDITNIGGSAAGAFVTRLVDPGTGADDYVAAGGLGAGMTTTKTFYFNYWVFDPDAELIAITDVKEEVDECKEDNNKLRYFKMG
ncbi:MAG: hypothetical protein HWE27_16000 [Gammaproteobacteria bacterium]|nr:hypothetical protein [Gammaproteobacteria bacterium]